MQYDILFHMLYETQMGYIPALDIDTLSAFTESERLLLEHCHTSKMNGRQLQDLIQKVLLNPLFDPKDIDHDLHDRLSQETAQAEGDIQTVDLWTEGDGRQEVKLYKRPIEKVLRELLSDTRLRGCQHFKFRLYRTATGERIFGGDSNGSITFQIAQLLVGEGIVPISIVLYIDGSWIKNSISIRPIYCKYY